MAEEKDPLTRGQGFGGSGSGQQPAQQLGKKYMIGIGISDYQNWSDLPNAVTDMEAVTKSLLSRYDFENTPQFFLKNKDANRKNVEKLLFQFTEKKKYKEEDALLIYYSGHGHLDETEVPNGYWVPYDAEKDDISSYFPNSRIREIIASIPMRHVLLISDSCYSGSLFRRSRGNEGKVKIATEYEKDKSRWALCSGRANEEVLDGNDGFSPFAKALIHELNRNESPKIHLSAIAERVTEITNLNSPQMPDFGPIFDTGHMGGQFVFTLRNAVQAPPLPDPADPHGHKADPAPPVSAPPVHVAPAPAELKPFPLGHKLKLAVLYDNADTDAATKLNKFMRVLQMTRKAELCLVHKAPLGTDTATFAQVAIAAADYVLIIVSGNLLNTDTWLGMAIEAVESGKKVIPILVSAADVTDTGLEKLQSLPTRQRRITDFATEDAGYNDIATEVRRLADT